MLHTLPSARPWQLKPTPQALLSHTQSTPDFGTEQWFTGRDLLSGGGVELVPGLDGQCGWETDSTGRAIGMTFLYICLNIWLFLGIAIICDGHFTASLEMICSDKGLNLNNDVAGATFMAAGSSAPELATSFVGTFLSDSNVRKIFCVPPVKPSGISFVCVLPVLR